LRSAVLSPMTLLVPTIFRITNFSNDAMLENFIINFLAFTVYSWTKNSLYPNVMLGPSIPHRKMVTKFLTTKAFCNPKISFFEIFSGHIRFNWPECQSQKLLSMEDRDSNTCIEFSYIKKFFTYMNYNYLINKSVN